MTSFPDLSSRRSNCPLNVALELIGDQWSLLILRDMLFWHKRRYGDFLDAMEGISTNILANRLRRLEQYGLVEKFRDPGDGKAVLYLPTDAGMDLLPVIIEIIRWCMNNDPQHGAVPPQVRECLRNGCTDLTVKLRSGIASERATLEVARVGRA